MKGYERPRRPPGWSGIGVQTGRRGGGARLPHGEDHARWGAGTARGVGLWWRPSPTATRTATTAGAAGSGCGRRETSLRR